MSSSLELTVEDLLSSLRKRKVVSTVAKFLGSAAGTAYFFLKEAQLLNFIYDQGGEFSTLFDAESMPYHVKQISLGAVFGCTSYIFLGTLYNLKHYRKKGGLRFLREVLKFPRLFLNRDADAADRSIKSYETGARILDDAYTRWMLEAEQNLKEGNAEEALAKYMTLLKLQEEAGHAQDLVQIIIGHFTNLIVKPTGMKNSARLMIDMAFLNLSKGLWKSADRFFERACQLKDPLQVQASCLYGHFLDERQKLSKGRTKEEISEKAQKQWGKTINLILADEQQRSFRRLGTSFHEVLEIAGQGLLHDTFIFKRNPEQKQLEREYKIEQFLHNLFQGSNDVVDPLALLAHNNHTYLVLRRVPGKPLTVFENSVVWDRAIEFVAGSHDRLRSKEAASQFPFPQRTDYGRVLRGYARRVAKNEEERATLVRETAFLADYLAQQPQQLIHGDFHPDNLFVRDEEGCTMLDPEHMMDGIRETDLVDIVESRLVPKKFTESEREGWRRRYHEAEKNGKSYDRFRLGYAYAAVARILKTIGALTEKSYGFTPKQSEDIRQEYGNKAQAQLEIIAQLDQRKKEEVKVLEERLVA